MAVIDLQAFGDWNRSLAGLATLTNPRDIPRWLVDSLNILVSCDLCAITVYSPTRKAEDIYHDSLTQWPEEDHANYFGGAYLLDPFYRAGIAGKPAGLYKLGEVAPAGFEQSEYFRTYYESSPISDEVNFLFYMDEDHFICVALDRKEDSPPFSEEEVQTLRQCEEMLEAVLLNYWGRTAEDRRATGSKLYVQLEQALGTFGDSVLTPREAEIMRLYLYGHDTRSIADRLDISVNTVAVHRKNAYARLDINSQSELFSLFISSMYCFQGDSELDPLALFLDTPK